MSQRIVIGLFSSLGIISVALLLFLILSVVMTGCDLRIPVNLLAFCVGLLIIIGGTLLSLISVWNWALV